MVTMQISDVGKLAALSVGSETNVTSQALFLCTIQTTITLRWHVLCIYFPT